MPEKTKLEDYANMNNTGFAFIDLNEELKENIKLSGYNYLPMNYDNIGNYKDMEYVLWNTYEPEKEIFNLFKKIKEIFESKKPLIIKAKFDCTRRETETEPSGTHIFYDTIIRNCSLYKIEEETYVIIMSIGSVFYLYSEKFTTKNNGILYMYVKHDVDDSYVFSMEVK